MYAYLPGGDSVDDITLPDIYTYKPFGGLIPLPDVVVYNHVKVHAWTGTEFPDNGGEQGETEPMVYVTASGSVYPKNPGCSYLNVSLKQIPGSSAKSASISTGSIIQPVKSAAGIRIRQEWYMLRNRETDTIIWSPAVG